LTRFFNKHILALLIFCTASALFSQTDDIRNQFNKGLILYRNNDMGQARNVFTDIIEQSSENTLITSSILMASKTAFSMQKYDEAIEYASILIDDYQQSSYLPHAFYARASAKFKKRNYSASVEDFVYCIEFSESPELLRIAESTATNIVDGYIGKSSLDKIYSAYTWKQAQPMLTIWRAHFAAKYGDSAKSKQMLQTFIASNPGPRYKIIAEELSTINSAEQAPVTRIGIIQPLAGYFATESRDFLKGMAFGIQKQKGTKAKIKIVLKETNGGIVETIKAARELLDENVDLVITGLEGQKSAAAAGILQQANIPVIIPVATDNNLAQLGDNIFQANSDMETRGSELAEYASKSLHMKNFATLAPADEYGNALTDAFTNTIDQLGGTIVSQQWYYPGTSDFSRQLESIREASFRYAYRDSIRAWGMDVNMARIDSLYARLDRSTRRNSDDHESLSEFTDIAVRSIDGFFLPIYEEDIPYIASQFALYNIKARLLGGDSWNAAELLRNQQRYVNGVVFFAGHFIDETELNYINFIRDFRIATSSSPGTMAIYGFNIMNLVLDGIEKGNTSANDIAEYLKSVKTYKGLGTSISFQDKNRVNSAVNILQFQDGNILRANPAE
jgi:ABC-type branched-subunit amino acid transport system substrate-binding protein